MDTPFFQHKINIKESEEMFYNVMMENSGQTNNSLLVNKG